VNYFFLLILQCQATNEEEIFEVQDKGSLLSLGWIHVIPALPFDYFFFIKSKGYMCFLGLQVSSLSFLLYLMVYTEGSRITTE
jgi:hypothetical protein